VSAKPPGSVGEVWGGHGVLRGRRGLPVKQPGPHPPRAVAYGAGTGRAPCRPTTRTTRCSTLRPWRRWRARIRAADVVVVLTGAGVSTGSGIPDYRGPQGLWTKDPERPALRVDRRLPGRRRGPAGVLASPGGDPSWQAEPNAAHLAIAELERLERLTALVTQNVDGLHLLAGSSPGRTIEIHGTVREVVCLSCGDRQPSGPILDRVRAGEHDPRCARCGGILKVATVSFGQSLDPALLQRAHDATMAADVFLAVGTSLTVHPVALLPRTALEAGRCS
jgi:NAD-dependent deacetylase